MSCVVCGYKGKYFVKIKIFTNELSKAWGLTPTLRKKFDERESLFCPKCRNSYRHRALAKGILKTFPFKNSETLKSWADGANKAKLKIAEVNACGNLHPFLKNIKGLKTKA